MQPSGADVQSFQSQRVNVIVGPISGSITRNSDGTLNNNRTLGLAIYDRQAQLQISLSRRVVNKILED